MSTLLSQNVKTFIVLESEKSFKDLESSQSVTIYTPATETQFDSIGVVPFEDGSIVKTIQAFDVLSITQSFRKVNKKKVKRLLKEKLAEMESKFEPTPEQDEFYVDKETLKDFEFQISKSLLPETEVEETQHFVIYDKDNGTIVVTNANKKVSENLTAFIRFSVGSLPVTEIVDEYDFSQSLKKLIESKKETNRISFTDSIALVGINKEKATFAKTSVKSEEVLEILADKSITSVGFDFDGVMTGVINNDLSFKGVKLDKELFQQDSSFDADAILVLNELNELTKDFLELLGK